MANSDIIVRYQTEPMMAAICPEFNLRLTNLKDFKDLEAKMARAIDTKIERERIFYSTYPQEIRKNISWYKRIKALHKESRDIEVLEALIQYEQTARGEVADKFGFKQ